MVLASYLDVTQITLQDETGKINVTLTSASSSNGSDATSIIINLGRDDLNIIKLFPSLATSTTNTFLTYTSDTIQDVFGNPLVNRAAHPVRNFTEDFIEPQLESFALDLTNDTLTLYFSETVNASTFAATGITLQSQSEITASEYVTLSSGSVGVNSHSLNVSLTVIDLNRIQELLDLATNVHISITSDLVQDMNGNPVVAIPNNTAIDAADFISDEVSPELTGFDLNLNRSQHSELTLYFSEMVSAPTLRVEGITLHNDSNSTNYYQLQSGDVQEENSSIIVVVISWVDTNLIKEMYTLATNENNTYLRLEMNTVLDMAGNEIQSGSAVLVDMFTPYGISPQLLNFSLDLNLGKLSLYFSETVNSLSTNFTTITFQSTNGTSYNDTTSFTLNDGGVSPTNSTDITVYVIQSELNTIKSLLNLATSEIDRFISFSEYLIEDMNMNQVVPIPENEALQAFMVVDDSVGPQLVSSI